MIAPPLLEASDAYLETNSHAPSSDTVGGPPVRYFGLKAPDIARGRRLESRKERRGGKP
jgi:hypothetical protein